MTLRIFIIFLRKNTNKYLKCAIKKYFAHKYFHNNFERNLNNLLVKIIADGGYTGELAMWAMQLTGWVLEIVSKVAGTTGFNVIPKRWIVERLLCFSTMPCNSIY